MKLVMVTYNEAIDSEVMDALSGCSLKNYTKVTNAYGKGASSGTHLGNDIWPGKNNIIYVACQDKEAKQLMAAMKQLRKTLAGEGIKAFLIPLEDIS